MGILAKFRRDADSQDAIRESAALTTVYLLEMNQKFEYFMREKVVELEGRVAQQQARLSVSSEVDSPSEIEASETEDSIWAEGNGQPEEEVFERFPEKIKWGKLAELMCQHIGPLRAQLVSFGHSAD